jgi:hypothetical protein
MTIIVVSGPANGEVLKAQELVGARPGSVVAVRGTRVARVKGGPEVDVELRYVPGRRGIGRADANGERVSQRQVLRPNVMR